MIPVHIFAGQQVALFGLGGSGIASARALQAGGAKLIAFDDEPQRLIQAEANGMSLPWRKLSGLRDDYTGLTYLRKMGSAFAPHLAKTQQSDTYVASTCVTCGRASMTLRLYPPWSFRWHGLPSR